MALRDKSLFLYGYEINNTNYYIPFKNSGGGSEIDAVLTAGFYTLETLATEIARAMNAADTSNTYTCTVDRTYSSNLQNRVTIATNGSFLSLLFSSGVTAAASVRDVIGFAHTNQTGATTYTGSTTTGTALHTAWYGFNYQSPTVNLRTIGASNIATDGTKETVWWSVQQFSTVQFKFEAQADVLVSWQPLIAWMVKGRPFELTPEVSSPTTVYSYTLEKSSADGKGLGLQMKEMIPDFPLLYDTGLMEFRRLAGSY